MDVESISTGLKEKKLPVGRYPILSPGRYMGILFNAISFLFFFWQLALPAICLTPF